VPSVFTSMHSWQPPVGHAPVRAGMKALNRSMASCSADEAMLAAAARPTVQRCSSLAAALGRRCACTGHAPSQHALPVRIRREACAQLALKLRDLRARYAAAVEEEEEDSSMRQSGELASACWDRSQGSTGFGGGSGVANLERRTRGF
jgi:hypothetical protein